VALILKWKVVIKGSSNNLCEKGGGFWTRQMNNESKGNMVLAYYEARCVTNEAGCKPQRYINSIEASLELSS